MKNDNPSSEPHIILRIATWATSLVGALTAFIGFIKLVQGNTGLATKVLLSIGIVALWVTCAYFYRFRQPPLASKKKQLALAGAIAIPLFSAIGFFAWHYFDSLPTRDIIVLVANFEGLDPQKYRVTESIIEQLRDATKEFTDAKVEPLGRSISEREGSKVAIEEGKKHKAKIVIWGWYGVSGDVVPLSVHFEVLEPPKDLPTLGSDVNGLIQTRPVAELTSFVLQPRLSSEMAYLSLFTMGLTRYAAKDWDGAIARFNKSLSQTKEQSIALDKSVIYVYRGLVYDEKKEYDKAIADYNQAIKLKPDYAKAYTNRGLVYDEKKEYDKALVDYNRAIKLQPDFAEAYYDRGIVYYQKKEYDKAIADYNQAIKLKPDFAEAYTSRGIVYDRTNEDDKALIDYNQAIKLNPDDANAYKGRGNVYADKKEYDKALVDYNQAIKLQPDDAYTYNNRGLLYRKKKEYDKALVDYNQAIKLQPDDAYIYSGRGLVYRKKKEYDKALVYYNQIVKLQPDYAGAYYLRGLVYDEKKEYDKAITDFNQALSLKIDDKALPYYSSGLVSYSKGDRNNAITNFKKALKLTEDDSLKRLVQEKLQSLGEF